MRTHSRHRKRRSGDWRDGPAYIRHDRERAGRAFTQREGRRPPAAVTEVPTITVAAERYDCMGAATHHGSRDPNRGLQYDALKTMWPHFVMQTFAAHARQPGDRQEQDHDTDSDSRDGLGNGKRADPSPDLLAALSHPQFLRTCVESVKA